MKLHLLHLLPLYHKFPWQFGEVDKFRQRERNKRVNNKLEAYRAPIFQELWHWRRSCIQHTNIQNSLQNVIR